MRIGARRVNHVAGRKGALCLNDLAPARGFQRVLRKQVFGTHATTFASLHFPLPSMKRQTRSPLLVSSGGEARVHACGCGSSPPGSGPGFGRTTPVVGTGEPRSGGS
jgi:hypothetical protein